MESNGDLISRSALIEIGAARKIIEVVGNWNELPGIAKAACTRLGIAHRKLILDAPAVDAVYRGVFEQVLWERNTAFEQLEEHGIPFGGVAPDVVKVVRCKDCKHFDMEYMECVNGAVATDNEGGADFSLNFELDDFCSYGERRADDGK